jgi:tetratricopeptide (TPR) repeat protein
MLQQFKRYSQALEIVNQGLEYAWSEDTIAHARVFASYYMFWKGQYREAVEVAEQALSYEFLADVDKSRAYHVIGLCYSQIYVETRELSDLDTAIKALNEAVVIDPTMGEAKEMLKGLRIQREKLLGLARVSPETEK